MCAGSDSSETISVQPCVFVSDSSRAAMFTLSPNARAENRASSVRVV